MSTEVFRLKAEPYFSNDEGETVKTPIENLVVADTYQEVEELYYELGEQDGWFNITDDVAYTITRTKITEIRNLPRFLYFHPKWNTASFQSDDELKADTGLYGVKVVFTTESDSGKIKKTTETIYVCADSTVNAVKMVNEELKSSTIEYVIRDCKFDKAVALYKPFDKQDLPQDDNDGR